MKQIETTQQGETKQPPVKPLGDLLVQYFDERYTADALVDEATRRLQGLVQAATTLTPTAQVEFCKYFTLEFALDGQIYVRRGAHQRMASHLVAEAAAAGIEVVGG